MKNYNDKSKWSFRNDERCHHNRHSSTLRKRKNGNHDSTLKSKT
jgi:hypothetical protein